ncbi:ESX secretion-associated protein EspG [Nocardia sp. NBC_00416]|uniref:ESX secretion-associated protein EspG n=1 Tax=Nocardia sp. NBC_00416 TaxID=2975991 RepID=UPI002E233EDB
MRSWSLTGLEFAALWEGMRESGALPAPFVLTCRIPLYRDYCAAKRAAGTAVRSRLGSDIEDVLDVVAKPDIRIVANAMNLVTGGVRTRLNAARRGGHAYLVEQVRGEPGAHGGEFVFREYGVVELGAAVASCFSDAEPGRLRCVDLSTHVDTDMDQEYGRYLTREPAEDPAWRRTEEFLRTPVVDIGAMLIAQGVSRFGPRQTARRVLEWRDLHDDGRYVISGQGNPVAYGVDTAGFAARIDNELTEVVRAIRDERR